LIQVLVAEPDSRMRTALCVWLSHFPNVELVGVARTAHETLASLRLGGMQLALLDAGLLAGLEAELLAAAQALNPAPRLVLLEHEGAGEGPALALSGEVERILKQALPDALHLLLDRPCTSPDS
jgi:DNA-binding NarL/FixJ family response regulator